MRRSASDAPVGLFFRVVFLELLPLLSVMLLALLTTIPIGFPGTIRMGGLFPLIGITYWTLVRPKNMPPFAVFLLGFFTDIVTFCPLGLHAFIFVALQSILKRQRRFLVGQGFWMMWIAFLFLACGFYMMMCAFQFVFTGAVLKLADIGIAAGIAWACVPLVLWLLSRLHDIIDLFDEPIA